MNFQKSADGNPIVSLDAPQEPDKKNVFVNSPATEGTYTWFSSRGDDLNPTPPESGRGTGTPLTITFTEAKYDKTEVDFLEPIELHSGQVWWEKDKWGFDDEWGIYVRLPASVVTENLGNTGNCNRVEIIPESGLYIYVSADGDGAYDVDLESSDAVPVPTAIGETGYWEIEDKWAEEIAPLLGGGVGKNVWNMYSFDIKMWFVRNINCGSPVCHFNLIGGSYKAEWIAKEWKLGFECNRVTAGAGKISGNFVCYRQGAT